MQYRFKNNIMEAKELRIGNLIEHKAIMCEVLSIDNKWLQLDNDQLNTKISECNPIPLTEEWLFKFGFIKTPTRYYIGDLNEFGSRDLTLVLCTKDNVISYDNYLHPIKYVHKLQNLYFALTCEELTIK